MSDRDLVGMASNRLSEIGFAPDIELKVSHAERSEIRAAYNRAKRLAEPQMMIQTLADYLDALQSSPRGNST